MRPALNAALRLAAALILAATCAQAEDGPVRGWLEWRGPSQNGTSAETKLPEDCDPAGAGLLWSKDIQGRGTVVTAGDRAYVWGYIGEKEDLYEVLACIEIDSGKLLWERRFRDFLSDIIYNRYSIGAPSVDAETGQVYVMTSPGLLVCYSRDGELVWEVSMAEEYGRLTFPNGRTGSPAIDGELVIVNAITSNWGAEGPAATRFYAFDKRSGELVWSSTPGERPKDSSFCTPYFEWRGGRRVFYATTGCGHAVGVDARTGKPLWRFPMSFGGANAALVVHKDRAIAIHGKENRDASTVGRMVAIKLGAEPEGRDPVVLGKDHELWRAELESFTSSPTLVGDTVYQVTANGVLHALNVETGKELWKLKLDNSQLHASALYGDGKLYISMWNGLFYIINVTGEAPKVVQKVQLAGKAIGSPSVWRGRIFVNTTEKLYCFGPKEAGPMPPLKAAEIEPKPGAPVALQAVPTEVLLQPGTKRKVQLRLIDAHGLVVADADTISSAKATWAAFVPPTAKVKAYLDAKFNDAGEIVAGPEAEPTAGAFKATLKELSGTIRGRVLAKLPISEDFEGFKLTEEHPTDKVPFAYPPLPWIGARFKWEVRKDGDSQVLAKTLDRVLFQRSTTFIGPSQLSNYTIEADVKSDGSRRVQSSIGLINQRYIIFLDGNWQRLEVFSNQERFKVNVPFAWKRKVWYRLKVRVDVGEDGVGTIRAKAWPREESEPEAWTLEATHEGAHRNGAPGFFAFSPQGQFRVYLDNVKVTPND